MAEARSEQSWAHTSALLAMLANVHRDPKKPSFKPSEFNPHLRGRKEPTPKVGVGVLKQVFVDQQPHEG